ncbi:Regulator of nonsense transcripts 1 (ATP-dependent helicase RENT1) (Nonsense mRNA reducing factor 1) (NORF1) (Up-frameshift suppressor 1 homolog) (mUpf1) [Durusdinium trenchii]|uniref:Regulator of nonsense transcripts 1 (ATP-dependent helicase RENT1) (Nonsense mRNA reducing factor 1) (NORF1) (Up-frameshift suppressor 1 homolog) (MUpf1) n=1 Tax=Durusdinium trenchii TaxID=1381693 RepID=A0ABP0P6B0_9DINO
MALSAASTASAASTVSAASATRAAVRCGDESVSSVFPRRPVTALHRLPLLAAHCAAFVGLRRRARRQVRCALGVSLDGQEWRVVSLGGSPRNSGAPRKDFPRREVFREGGYSTGQKKTRTVTGADAESPWYCPVCRMTCSSAKSLRQHLEGKRHLKMVSSFGAFGQRKNQSKKQNLKEAIGKKAWAKLKRAKQLAKMLEMVAEKEIPHGWLVDLLSLAAEQGGAKEFAEVLMVVQKDSKKFSLRDFHRILKILLLRVPTPFSFVRLLLNCAVQRHEDLVPLLPPTLGFGARSEDRDEEEMDKLFGGCAPPGEEESGNFAYLILKKVNIEGLMARMEGFAENFAEYYPHFLVLLVLDFMEELSQDQIRLSRGRGKIFSGMFTMPSDNGKSLICSSIRQSEDLDLQRELAPGDGILLCKSGQDPRRGGAVGYGRVEAVNFTFGRCELVLNVGAKQTVQELSQMRALDLYSSVNLIAFERQLEALERVSSKGSKDKKRYPLWDLLPMSGVGGDILDSWAARMRSAVQKERGTKTDIAQMEELVVPATEVSAGVERLQQLAEASPQLPSFQGRLLLKDFNDLLEGQESLCDPEIQESIGRLNDSQQDAVQAALNRRVTVIQGPPGTGKTHVSSEVLRMWASMGLRPVLVTSHNNIAVDNIAEKALAAGLRVVRLAKADWMNPVLDGCSLWKLVDEQVPHTEDRQQRYFAQKRILDEADVICVTTISSATPMLSGRKVAAILMDEAAQTTELSALVPIASVNAERLVLVGDHCQLPANSLSLEAEMRGLTLSLFQRWVSRGLPSFFLDTQFRMHPCIAEHSSIQFYGGKLLSGVLPEHRLPPKGFAWPREQEGEGVALLDTSRLQERFEMPERASWCNPREARILCTVLRGILKAGELSPAQIGVVTPYMGQVRELRRTLQQFFGQTRARELLVASVDSYQGREKELILFSAVRSNSAKRVGFLADWRRLNVMITRARRGLVIVGDTRTLCHDPAWAKYVRWAKRSGYLRAVVEADRNRWEENPLSAILSPPSTHMGATTSAALPDDAACEDVLRMFIAEDLERAERLLRRAEEQLGVVWLVAQARKSQRVWTIIGLDGTTFQLPVDEMANVDDLSKTIAKRIGMRAGGKLVLFAGGQILEDSSKFLQQEGCGREISYVVQQVCALEAAIGFHKALTGRTRDHMHATVTDAIASLTFGWDFNQSLKGVTLPSSLQTLTFGSRFNQSLEGVTLPSSLQTLTFGWEFNQGLEGVTLPSSLQTLTFGWEFNQSLEGVTLPSSLQTLTFGDEFNQSLEGVILPSSLQTLIFGESFDQSLEWVTLPSNLRELGLPDFNVCIHVPAASSLRTNGKPSLCSLEMVHH